MNTGRIVTDQALLRAVRDGVRYEAPRSAIYDPNAGGCIVEWIDPVTPSVGHMVSHEDMGRIRGCISRRMEDTLSRSEYTELDALLRRLG